MIYRQQSFYMGVSLTPVQVRIELFAYRCQLNPTKLASTDNRPSRVRATTPWSDEDAKTVLEFLQGLEGF